MSIEWTQEPAYGWGNGAGPAQYSQIMRRVFEDWDPDVYSIVVTPDAFGPEGIARIQSNLPSNKRRATNLEGSTRDLRCWVGNNDYVDAADLPVSKTCFTLVYPNADLQLSVGYDLQSWDSYNETYLMYVRFKWFMASDHTAATTPNGGSFATLISQQPKYPTGSAVAGAPAFGYPGQCAIWYTDGSKNYFGMTVFSGGAPTVNDPCEINDSGLMIDIERFSAYLQRLNPSIDFGVWETEEISPEAGPASQPGGYGGYGGDPTDSDSPQWPDMPGIGASQLGFINMYNPSIAGLNNIGEEIFPDLSFTFVVDPTGNDVVNAILNACGAFVDIFNQIPQMFEIYMNSRLIDYVQDCHVIPVAPTTTSSAPIKLGYRTLTTTAPVVTSDYVDVSLGTIDIDELYKMFIDYQPYTRAKIYLPFVGFVPLEPEYFQAGKLEIKYRFNVYDGSFIAGILATPSSKVSKMYNALVAQYAGTACIHMPLTGLNYSSMVAGLVGGAGAMCSAIGSGNPAASAAAALNTATASPQVMTSNGYTASAAFLGMRYAFIVIERSKPHFPASYQHDVGLPSRITTTLGSAKGFVRVTDVDLSGFQASEAEKEEIRKLLAGGIYV